MRDANRLILFSGGMGLTGGLVDVGNLFDCLYGIYTGQADDSILDKYSDIRIRKYKEVIDPISSGNIRRLWDPSEEAIKAEPFFQMAIEAENSPQAAEKMKAGQRVSVVGRRTNTHFANSVLGVGPCEAWLHTVL